jgi:hypothetical protein
MTNIVGHGTLHSQHLAEGCLKVGQFRILIKPTKKNTWDRGNRAGAR